jgi:hypothetical protein
VNAITSEAKEAQKAAAAKKGDFCHHLLTIHPFMYCILMEIAASAASATVAAAAAPTAPAVPVKVEAKKDTMIAPVPASSSPSKKDIKELPTLPDAEPTEADKEDDKQPGLCLAFFLSPATDVMTYADAMLWYDMIQLR